MREKARRIKRLWEDEFLLVLAKPAGVVTTSTLTFRGETLEDWLKRHLRKVGCLPRSGIVHRLDRGTSGIVLVAKTKRCFDVLKEDFKKRRVRKRYVFLAEGRLPKEGVVFAPIAKNPKMFGSFRVFVGGKEAKTCFRINHFWQIEGMIFSLGEAYPITGRTHQIRVHLSYLGHPIVGDSIYGSSQKVFSLDRIFLHAAEISFVHPITGERLRFSLKLPPELRRVLRWLEEKGKKIN